MCFEIIERRLVYIITFPFFLLCSVVEGQEWEVDFRDVAAIPANVIPVGGYQAGDFVLGAVNDEQVLAVDNTGISSPWSLGFEITGLSNNIEDFPYLVFHYKLASPKPAGGLINFRLQLTINGIKTQWNAATQTGVINANLAADSADWVLAVIDLRPLMAHWREQVGLVEPMLLETVHIGPGAIHNLSSQYWDVIYFRGLRIGPASKSIGLDPQIVESAQFSAGTNGWVYQGEDILINPLESGTVYMTKIRDVNMSDPDYAINAVRQISVTSGRQDTINTTGLETGTYDLALVINGIIEDQQQIHLAMTQPPLSPDYEITVLRTNEQDFEPLTTYYSYGKEVYYRQGERMTFTKGRRPVVAHSWASISTNDYPLTIRVKVKLGAEMISLPLSSAAVLPSSDEIPCQVISDDTIEFILTGPEKVMVVSNYTEAWDVFVQKGVDHIPIQSWSDNFTVETQRENFHALDPVSSLTEGYRNPLVLLARSIDPYTPNLNDPSVLVVDPGDQPNQVEIDAAEIVWFRPGVHDFSRMGIAPLYHTYIRPGQVYYLEEEAYLLARIVKEDRHDPTPCYLVGRGTVSGINHFWGYGGFENGSQVIEVDVISGVNVIDRAYFGVEGGSLIEDVALLGSWHGNCDGLDSLDHCIVRDCFLMAHDDNLKINTDTYAEDIVLYMIGTNAHPIMFKEILTGVVFENSFIKDIDILGYWKDPQSWNSHWSALGPGAIGCLTASDMVIRNITFSDIRIESPFLYRVFSFYNMDTNQGYTPEWFNVTTTEEIHTRIDGISFENITITSPLIGARSVFGSAYSNSLNNLSFTNIDINGVRVTEANKEQYFEIGSSNVMNEVTGLIFHDSLYAEWSHRYMLAFEVDGDDDGDGVPNLAEFAFGGNPLEPADKGYNVTTNVSPFGLNFTYPVLAKRNNGLVYTIESSRDLFNWQPVEITPQRINVVTDFDFLNAQIPFGGESNQFFRLTIKQ